MKKIDYIFTLKTPLHTGGFNTSVLCFFRKQKKLINQKRTIKTKFLSTEVEQELKREALALLCCRIMECFSRIDWKNINSILERALLQVSDNKYNFLNDLSNTLGISNLEKYSKDFNILRIVNLFDSEDLSYTLKRESKYIISMSRSLWIKQSKYKKTETNIDSPQDIICQKLIEVEKRDFMTIEQTVHIAEIPIMPSNSIRGILRRLLMADFCKKVEISNLPSNLYYQLFCGGSLSSQKDAIETDQLLKIIQICPPLGLFGSALGNFILRGNLVVNSGILKCIENDNGVYSYYEFLDYIYKVRRNDDSGPFIEINQDDKDVKEDTRMFVDKEVICPGAEFEHTFICTSDNPLILSAFTRMLEVFIEQPFIGASRGLGLGEIDLNDLNKKIDALPSSKMYLDYLEENKKNIRAYFDSSVLNKPKERAKKQVEPEEKHTDDTFPQEKKKRGRPKNPF